MRRSTQAATLLPTLLALAAHGPLAQTVSGQDVRPVVAVMDFSNSSLVDHEAYEPFRVGLAGMLIASLQQNESIELVERERLREVLDEIELAGSGSVNPETAAEAGRILGAHHIIVGVFVIDRGDNLRLDARAVNVETSRIEHVETVTDDADNLLRAVERLGQQLSSGLELPTPSEDGNEDSDGQARPGQMQANLKYARGMLEEDRGNLDEARALYRAFLSESPVDYAPALRASVQKRMRSLEPQRRR